MNEFRSWTSIGSFSAIVKNNEKYNFGATEILYMGKDILKDVVNGEADIPEGIDWKKITSAITQKTRNWYLEKSEIFS